MKYLTKTMGIFAGLAFFVSGVAVASAQISVPAFANQQALFSELDLLPGYSVSKDVTVTNDYSDDLEAYLDTLSESNTDGLGDVITLTITAGNNTLYSDTFTNLFATDTVSLGTISGNNGSQTYTFTAEFLDTAGNDYQDNTLGFSLCIGLEGNNFLVCDGSSDPGGGGGGGGGTSNAFTLFDEDVDSVDEANREATLAWSTNKDATTYLVCGNTENDTFDLDLDETYLGYEFEVTEVDDDTKSHSVTLTNLSDGTYECRPASRRATNDAFTVGEILQFTIASDDGTDDGTTTITPGSFSIPTVLGETVEAAVDSALEAVLGEATTTEAAATPIRQALEVITDEDIVWWLILLLVFTLGWSLIDDLWRQTTADGRRHFSRNLIFSALFGMAVLLLPAELVNEFWWAFAGLWLFYTGYDYREHANDPVWQERRLRFMFYTALSLVFVITAVLFSFPPVWWPFAAILAGSAALVAYFTLTD